MLLDLPTGNTRDTRELIRMGYGVISSDLFPSKKRGEPDGLCWLQADMWAPIPLKDASLDYILNSEGIEHISDQFAFLKECARVLKRKGILAITTPNLLSLRARVAFMLAG
ncbi:MAG: class I SAM-dependent methyltransferase, partial [Candidatus Hydrogenedentes bacterium]|nr:class I SAM-dependent methyltransferase [Candidatus Hydrogenedentota bacterium]